MMSVEGFREEERMADEAATADTAPGESQEAALKEGGKKAKEVDPNLAKAKAIAIAAAILIVIGLVIGAFVFSPKDHGAITKEDYLTLATLKDAIAIDNLSTAEFVYSGIAEHYREEGEERAPWAFWESDDPVNYRIYYQAVVRASIDMNDIDFQIDDTSKTVFVSMPQVSLSTTVNPNEMQFIPENVQADPQSVLATCQADVENEARNASGLVQTAKENLQSVIEALTLPIIDAKGYSIEWVEEADDE